MAKFSDILGELAPAWARGAERYMEEERALAAQKRAFQEMAPLRKEAKAEEVSTLYGPKVAQQFITGGLAEGLEGLKKEREAAEIAAAGGEIATIFPGVTPQVMPPTERAETEPSVPFTPKTKPGLEALKALGLQQAKTTTDRPRAMTMTEIRGIAAMPGHPDQAWAKRVLSETAQERVGIASQILGEKPIEAATQKDIVNLEETLSKITGVLGATPEIRKERAGTYLSPQRGASAGFREYFNQFTGGYLMGKDEQTFRGVVADISDLLLRARSGAQINEQEFARLMKLAPNLGMAPENFSARLELFIDEYRKTIERKKRMATTPRRELRREVANRAAFGGLTSDETFIEVTE